MHLCTSPNYHTAVTTFAGNALNSGHAVVFMDKWDPEQTLAKIERYRCTHTHMVPTQFNRMLQLPDDVKTKYDVSSMRWAIHAAAPCPVDVKRQMLDWWGPVIWEYYGATEGGGTTATPEDWLKYPGTVGSVWPISELKIVDDDTGKACAPGEPGIVWMRMGAQDFEYKGDKAKTDESHDADGLLHRRRRRLPQRGRLPVPLRPQERHDHRRRREHLPGRDRGRDPGPPGGRRRRGVRHPRRRHGRADQGRRRGARGRRPPTTRCGRRSWSTSSGRLAKFKWPRSIDFIDELPREPTGKLLKRKLRDPYWADRQTAI